MTNEKKVPKLRFPGFTDAWEQRKLGDIGSTFTGLTGKTKDDFGHGEAKFVTYLNIFNNPIADPNLLESVEIDKKQNEVTYGDIFFTTSSETPEEVGMSSIWLKNQQNVYLNSFCFGYRPKIELAPYFIAFNLRSEPIRKQFTFLAQGISRFNISKNKVMEMIINLPSIEEQKKIGLFFKQLENSITLQQRKCDNLKKLKKCLLQKMFPKNGSNFPELRFPGFTDAWEQCKFSDVVQLRRGLTYKPTDVQDTGVRVLRSSNINEDTFVYGDDDVFVNPNAVNIEKAKQNDILITSANGSSRLVGKHALIKEIANDSAVHGGFMLLGRTNNYDFINASMSSSWYTKFINTYVAGGNGAIGNLSKPDLDEQLILIPSDLEQKKIGEYFSTLDNLITLQLRKLESMKQLKKGLLQQMFV